MIDQSLDAWNVYANAKCQLSVKIRKRQIAEYGKKEEKTS